MLALMPNRFKALLASLNRYLSFTISTHNECVCVAWLVSMKVSMIPKGMFAVLEPSDITPVVMSREFSETCDFFSGCSACIRKQSIPL